MREDMLSTGVNKSIEYVKKAQRELEKALNDTIKDFTTKGVEVVNSFADQLVYPMEDVEKHPALDNVGIVRSLDATKRAEIRNDNEISPFIEFGTGRVGEANPHPNPSLANWEYYVDTIHKKTDRDGREGWWYGGEFRLGIVSMPFMYTAGNEIERLITTWLKENIERRMLNV